MKISSKNLVSLCLSCSVLFSMMNAVVLPIGAVQVASAATASSPIFSDDFNTGTLTNWNSVSGSWTNTGTAAQGVSTADGLLVRQSAVSSDFTYEADIKLLTAKAAGHLYFRSSSDGKDAYAVTLDSGASTNVVKLFKFTNNEYAPIKTVNQTLTTDQTYHLKVVTSGSSIKIYLDGATTPIIDATDTSFASGQFGLGSYGGTVQYDNVVATDNSAPAAASANFSLNGNDAPVKSVSTVVTARLADTSTLKYQWTKNSTSPDGAWTSFANGDMLTQSGVVGDWYLYVSLTDTSGAVKTFKSNVFHLDNTLITAGAQAGLNGSHWGFESGTLEGWNVVSNPSNIPILASNAFFHNNATTPYNKEGKYFLSTLEGGGTTYADTYNAVVVSPQVTLTRPTVSMLVGGGNGTNTYVAACTVDTSQANSCREVGKMQGANAETMQLRSLDLSAYLGQKIFFKMFDNSNSSWGHVTLDDIWVNIPAMPKALNITVGDTSNDLTWQPVIESQVAGYNVYRSTDSQNGFIKLNDNVLTATSYHDSTGQANTAYYYRITTVGTDGSESTPASNIAFHRPAQDLYGRGSTITYSGTQLTAIQFPVGPIGAGGIRHFGTGERSEAWIFNSDDTFRNRTTGIVPNSFFAVRAQSKGGQPVVKALQTTAVGTFNPMKSLTFQGEYPLGKYNFQDDQLPVQVSQEVFNPMIPGNMKDSGIPTAIYTMTFTNLSTSTVDVSLLASQQNAVGFNGISSISGTNKRDFSGYGSNSNTLQIGSNASHLQMTGTKGSMTLSVLGPQTAGTASWNTLDALQTAFASGSVTGANSASSPQTGTTVDGALTSSLTLAPGETKQVKVLLSWYFPTNPDRNFGGEGMQYTNWWNNASEVDQYVTSNLTSLQAQTELYHNTLYSSNIPQYVLDRLTSATALLHTPTVFWAKNGFFGGWEGYGCCVNMPNHVWHYAQAHSRLWPQLGQMFDQQWLNAETASGLLPFRYNENTFAFDGQTGVVLSAYRDYLQSSDPSWLNTYWTKIKGAMDYVIIHHDPNGNGILQGGALTTLDAGSPTMNSWLGSMYLAAVNASAHLAKAAGDTVAEAKYNSIYSLGRTNQETMLWNGQYYDEKSQGGSGATNFIGNGSEIDMLLGQWWSTQLGLGDIYDPAHMTLALKNLYKNNFYDNFINYTHQYRTYVEPNDAGLVMATWPGNDRPSNSIMYFDEVMSGFEYSAAATMIQRGLLDEGLNVVNAASNRYDGRLRNQPYMSFGECGIGDGTGNPFGDDECGQWYGRTLSSWSLLLALQGFNYDAPHQAIGFAPTWQPNDHKSFFTAANGYGTFNQKRDNNGQSDSINVASGTLDLKTFSVSVPADTSNTGWSVSVNGRNVEGSAVALDGTTLTATLPQTVTLSAGDQITLQSGIAATRVTVTGANGITSITQKGGTLKMSAAVEPAKATDKSVTWAVYDADNKQTDLATISADGLLTAQKDGTVKVVATANGASGVQGEVQITISGQTEIPTGPAAVLTGTSSVLAGQSFTDTYGLSGLTQSVFAQDLTLTYDPDKLEYISAHSAKDGFQILKESDKPGQIRFIAAITGANAANPNGDLLTLHWKAKSVTASATTAIVLSNVTVANGDGVETHLSGNSHNVLISLIPVDKTALAGKITDAQTTLDAAEEGNQVGQYPAGSKATLQAAIDQAAVVANHTASTQQQVDQAAADLTAALQVFTASVNTQAPVVKTALNTLIADAQTKHNTATEGTQIGQYPVGSKATLQAVIDRARAVANDSAATQQQVDQAFAELNAALHDFTVSVIIPMSGDINGDGKISIGDLAMVAANYGKTKDSEDWDLIKSADVNGDFIIDLADLVMIALQILQ
ncbi:GH116 family glycosyl-hydrolase [Paenibacillus sp. N3.4]|uniref:GH116 family glycosyl-hydrolase n=1 Tax=Paenibacillus sp. N3.4 TaxID=2603222 RepID=UPI0016502608|nr:GH116 family glycosyl-hydrolase [Paenibacillus sp. N3.4]